MAYPVTLNGRTYTLADFEGQNYVDGLPDAFEDFVTHAGNLYSTTSTTSNSIGTGSKTFTVESSKPYQVGTPLRITDSAAPSTNWIDAIVTAYSGTTLTVDAVAYAGSGTKTSWNINIGGGGTSYTGTLPVAQGGTGATTAAAARTNLDVYSKADADSRFLNVSGEASDVSITGDLTVDTTTFHVSGSNNRVGIGTVSPEEELHIVSASTTLKLEHTSDTATSILYFSDSDDENKYIIGYGSNHSTQANEISIKNNLSDGKITLHTNGAKQATLDESGRFLFGKETNSANDEGVIIRKTGQILATATGEDSGVFTRSNEGDIVLFRQGTGTVGSIGAYGGVRPYFVREGDGGFTFGSDGSLVPADTDGSGNSGQLSLGSSGSKWKDLWISDGVYLGGITNSNKLEDYEEGNFTPYGRGGTTAGTWSAGTTVGRYTKVGDMVTAYVYISGGSLSGASGTAEIAGFPFVAGSPVTVYSVAIARWSNITLSSNAALLSAVLINGNSVATIRESFTNNTSASIISVSDISQWDVVFALTYRAT